MPIKGLSDTADIVRAVGLGDVKASLQVFVANRPPLDEYQYLDGIRPMRAEEIKQIADLTGNHWRKIFNVYAKFIFALQTEALTKAGYPCWQDYRDQFMLQPGSRLALLFSDPDRHSDENVLRIVMGKGYAAELRLPALTWLNEHFAINKEQRIIVCPYFDYRQLSNIRIEFLVNLIAHEYPRWLLK